MNSLKHGEGHNTGSEAEDRGLDDVGSAGVLRRGSGGGGAVALELAVRDLLDGRASRLLELAISDLLDWAVGRSLHLAISDLGHWSSGGSGCLELTVGNLLHWCASRSLDLSVGNLRYSHSGDLTVGHLRCWRTSDLTVGKLRSAATGAVDDLDVDRRALLGLGLIVEVVEGAGQALVESAVTLDGERAVAADGESGGELGISLAGCWVELELVVGNDVTDASLGVGEDSILELDHEGGGLTLLHERGALGWVGDVHDLDLEGAGVVLGALSRGGSLREGGGERREGERGNEVLHCCGGGSINRIVCAAEVR